MCRIILAAAFLALAQSPAFACVCSIKTEADVVRVSPVVIRGEVTAVRLTDTSGPFRGQRIATIRVTQTEKGDIERLIEVTTSNSPNACGIPFVTGDMVRTGLLRGDNGWAADSCLALKPRGQR
jgi:hypothetical protein